MLRKIVRLKGEIIVCASALLVTGGVKIWLAASPRVPFNADEAVVALMARHILQGDRPAFFYGQAYMGSLDAWLIALGFMLLGEKVWVIRLVQGGIYLAVVATSAWLGKVISGDWRVGAVTAWLLALPSVNVTLYTTISLGGYGEALLLGNLILLITLRIVNGLPKNYRRVGINLFLWGFLAGMGLWVFGLTLVYTLPAGIYLLWKLYQAHHSQSVEKMESSLGRTSMTASMFTLLGGVLGSLPWWSYAFKYGFPHLLAELSGEAIAGVEGLPWLAQIGQHAFNLIVLGSTVVLGLRPPWGIRWLAMPLLPIVLMVWLVVLVFMVNGWRRRGRLPEGSRLLGGVVVTFLMGFVITPFGADPSGRYFLPLAAPLAIFAAMMIVEGSERFGSWAYLGLVGVILYNTLATVQCYLTFPPGLTSQFDPVTQINQRWMGELIAFLREEGERRGYSNYWVSYPLAFLSEEEIIFVPRLPYHQDFRYTRRDDRYPPYDELVSQAERVAYITTRHPELDEYLRANFRQAGITWREKQIGDYHVFYSLSKPIRAEAIDLP